MERKDFIKNSVFAGLAMLVPASLKAQEPKEIVLSGNISGKVFKFKECDVVRIKAGTTFINTHLIFPNAAFGFTAASVGTGDIILTSSSQASFRMKYESKTLKLKPEDYE